jgi:uncharacterized protein (DUF2062 family)
MPRRYLKRVLPQRHTVREQWFLRPFRALLHDPALWALHRRNVLRATTVGIVAAFVPFPGQTALAGVLAVYFRCNVPVALLVSMLSNPVTIGPMYYGAYRLGLLLLGRPPVGDSPELELAGIWSQWDDILVPLLLGCAIMATLIALAARWLLNWLWVTSTRREMNQRAAARRR